MGLVVEFEGIFKDRPVQGTYDRFPLLENRYQNCYLDVPCLAATAVSLSVGTHLHANWVHGYCLPHAYILAQGALNNTARFLSGCLGASCIGDCYVNQSILRPASQSFSYWPSKFLGLLSDPKHEKQSDSGNAFKGTGYPKWLLYMARSWW